MVRSPKNAMIVIVIFSRVLGPTLMVAANWESILYFFFPSLINSPWILSFHTLVVLLQFIKQKQNDKKGNK